MKVHGDTEIILEPDKSRSSYMYTADLIFVMTLYIAQHCMHTEYYIGRHPCTEIDLVINN